MSRRIFFFVLFDFSVAQHCKLLCKPRINHATSHRTNLALEVFERIKTSGHDVGNHTMHHLRGFEHSCEVYLNDVAEAQGLIQSHFFRSPHGRVTFKQLKALKEKYTIVMRDVITRDYNQNIKPE